MYTNERCVRKDSESGHENVVQMTDTAVNIIMQPVTVTDRLSPITSVLRKYHGETQVARM